MDEATQGAQAAVARIEASWDGLLGALAGIPDNRLGQPGVAGDWTLGDVMGHIAYWDGQAAVAGRRFLAGEPNPEVDWQAANEREVARGKHRPPAEHQAAMLAAHAAVAALLAGTPSPDSRFAGLCGCLQGDTFEHYDEHAADIRAWRTRVGV